MTAFGKALRHLLFLAVAYALLGASAAIAGKISFLGAPMFTWQGTQVVLYLPAMQSSYPFGTTSGALRVELVASSTPLPAADSDFVLASKGIPKFAGGEVRGPVATPMLPFNPPPDGWYYVSIRVMEATGSGAVQRDIFIFPNTLPFGNAPNPYQTAPELASVVEFYNVALDHYFMTADVAEIVGLDGGGSWVRTGYSFKALKSNQTSVAGSAPVCRLYGNPAKGLDSHFYSASVAECLQVPQQFVDSWLLESDSVFRVWLADAQTGACPGDTVPVYRVFNNRTDANHRYTPSLEVLAEMLARGYTGEGYGKPAVAFCAAP